MIDILKLLQIQLNQNNDNFFKIETNERDGYHFIATSKRYSEFEKSNKTSIFTIGKFSFSVKDFQISKVSPTSSSIKIKHPIFNDITNKINAIRETLTNQVVNTFITFIDTFVESYSNDIQLLSTCIGTLDVYNAHAKNAYKYRYYRPRINNMNGTAYQKRYRIYYK